MTNDHVDLQGQVEVRNGPVDWNNLEWSTLRKLGAAEISPGSDIDIVAHAVSILKHSSLGTIYVNPQYAVTAPAPTKDFFREAKRAQLAWLKRLKSVLGTSGRLKKALRHEDTKHLGLPKRGRRVVEALLRQLENTGVMIVKGKHVHPQHWPKGHSAVAQTNLVGQTFGRLTVQQRLTNGRWECRCCCGGQNVVKTKHLLRNTIRSCGCLKAEVAAKRKARKQNRAWVKTGELSSFPARG